ncbi:sialic acid-binding Ig-like lectin 9 [Spea bombifrons]|uniref:sialic acid-binding Ig-like lectin 9 n=1 Tax=Spea bombifrons TaxID=233779 RepID=UPI00234B0703|nr:sialic acid-binding Ig-like lectin 9 [Spea bombifrons]
MMPVTGYWGHRPCSMPWIIILHLLALLFWYVDGQSPGFDIMLPQSPVEAQRGLCVHIPCSFTVPADVQLTSVATGYWCKDTTCSATKAIASKTGNGPNTNTRFLLTGDVSKRDCSLSINDLQSGDGGTYQFRIEDSSVRLNYGKTIQVKVTELTDKPEISPEGALMASREVTLTCFSPGRCAGSSPDITWEGTELLNNVTFQPGSVDYGEGNKTFYSNITFTPTIKNNNVLLSCRVSFRNGPSTNSQTRLNVQCASGNQQIDDNGPTGCDCGTSINLIAGIAAGSVFINILICTGCLFCSKKMQKSREKNKPIGNTRKDLELNNDRTESTYETLKHQNQDVYSTIKPSK